MARVLWVGVAGNVTAWRQLAGYQQQPHVTLARTRDRADLTNLVAEIGSYTGPWWTAEQLALVESHLGQRGGPRYERIESFPLSGSVAAAAD